MADVMESVDKGQLNDKTHLMYPGYCATDFFCVFILPIDEHKV